MRRAASCAQRNTPVRFTSSTRRQSASSISRNGFRIEIPACRNTHVVTALRPAVRPPGPDGREWELYAYKVAVRERAEWDTDLADTDGVYGPAAAELAVVNAVVWIVMLVPRMLMRLADAAV